jgi:hypothetical protein
MGSIRLSAQAEDVMAYPSPLEAFWAVIMNRYRCAEVDGEGDRCQLVIGHKGQHLLWRDGRRLVWPVGAEPHDRPPWATTFPRDEEG